MRSTSVPASLCRIRSVENVAGSAIVGVAKHTVIGGVTSAVVETSYARPRRVNPPGTAPAVAGSIATAVVFPAPDTVENVTVTSGDACTVTGAVVLTGVLTMTMGVQLVAPATEVVPAGHGVDAVAPAPLAKLPAGDSVQAAAPCTAEYVPGAQSVAVVAPVVPT